VNRPRFGSLTKAETRSCAERIYVYRMRISTARSSLRRRYLTRFRGCTLRAFTRCRNIAQFRMTDETLGVILIVEKWNRSRMVAGFKLQLECFVSHCVLALLSFAAGFALRLFYFAVEFRATFWTRL